MNESESEGPRAGGVILAGAILLGAVAGVVAGQATVGVLSGIGLGVVAALAVWLRDRARRG